MYRYSSVILCCIALASCSGKAPKPVATRSPTPQPTVKAQPSPTIGPVSVRAERSRTKQVSIVVEAHNRILYRILADSNDSRRTSKGTYTAHFTNPTITFFDAQGGQMRATARTADADGASKIVNLHNAVRVITADGSVLTCDQFSYDQLHNHVHGWGHVVVKTKQGDTLHGEDLTGDTQLSSVHVDG